MRIYVSIWIFCCLILSVGASTQNPKDDFLSGLQLFQTPLPTGFQVDNEVIADKKGNGGILELRPRSIAEFDLSFQLKFVPGEWKNPATFSIIAERSYGVWRIILSPYEKGGGALLAFFTPANKEFGEQMYFMKRKLMLPIGQFISCRLIADDSRLELYLDGKKHLLGSAPGFGKVKLQNYRLGYELRNVVLNYTPATEKEKILSKNIVPNSSFEYATNRDVPDYWSGSADVYRSNGVPNLYATAKGRKLLRDIFALQSSDKSPHGDNSLMLTPPAHLMSKLINITPQKKYVLSAYIKCDQGEKVTLGVTQSSIKQPLFAKTYEGNGQYQRVELPFNSKQVKRVSVFARTQSEKPFEIDAIQLEQGEIASPYQPCFADTGFLLANDVNADACADNVNSIDRQTKGKFSVVDSTVEIDNPELRIIDPQTSQYALTCSLKNSSNIAANILLSAVLTEEYGTPILLQRQIKLLPNAKEQIEMLPFALQNEDKVSMRLAVNYANTLDPCVTLKKTLYAPAILKCYTEYPFYLPDEKTVRMVVELSPELQKSAAGGQVSIRYLVPEDAAYPFFVKTFPVLAENRAVYEIPREVNVPGKTFAYEVQVISATKKILHKSMAKFMSLNPGQSNTALRVNRINRGIYFNEEEFFPSGILVYPDFGSEQLAYYKQCGFDDITVVTTWSNPAKNKVFMEECLKNNLRVFVFHQQRKYSLSSFNILEEFRKYPNFAGMIPNDESPDVSVYESTLRAKENSPERLIWCNQNFSTYRAFANRLVPMPGDVLSIDRYPFILQPLCRPQPTRDIYSIDQCLKMLAADAERERKPVFLWLQSSEKFDKEPTPEQLTYQLYCGVINRAMGFCYFGSLPESDVVWQAMISLNQELKALRPYLFSRNPEPKGIVSANPGIRILSKKLNDEIVVIALNFSLQKQTGVIKGMEKSKNIEILFEDRTITSNSDGILTDQFEPLSRHVYRLKIK